MGTVTPDLSDEESGEAFTDGDFDDIGLSDEDPIAPIDASSPISLTNDKTNEAINVDVTDTNGDSIFLEDVDLDDIPNMNGYKNGFGNDSEPHNGNVTPEIRRESLFDQSPSIVGILGGQQNHAEQRLAARRAARAEAREIRMRELERQQREQENHADKAYDMYTETVSRRAVPRLSSLSPAVHSPRRSSEDSDDTFSVKELRHELKEVEEKFRKAMILNAQLDNDKAALGYQIELLKDKLDELTESHVQLQREHKEKCSAHERLKRSHASLERELTAARDAVRARDAAANAAGYAFVEAAGQTDEGAAGEGIGTVRVAGEGFGTVPPLALISRQAEEMLNDAGEGTLDVRLQKLLSTKQGLESEVRKLKLTLNEERAARQNGVSSHHDQEYENELETLRKSVAEAKGRCARAEAEAALSAASATRLEAQVARLKARQDSQDEHEEQLKQERRKLQREAREALNRVEELETENSHLTKRLDKLKNAKSALLKDL